MKTLPVFYLIFFTAFIGAITSHADTQSVRPNILLIVSDDQGYADAGFQGSKDIPTPHLDQLAASGVRFTNAYVTAPFCSPSRAGLMTGRYQERFGHEGNPIYDPANHIEGLPRSETLLPEYLASAGYATGWIGKWHLGAAPEFAPGQRGFQETYGFIGGIHAFRAWKNNAAFETSSPIEQGSNKIYHLLDGGHYFSNWKININVEHKVPVDPPAHITPALGQAAAAYVRQHRHEPWFLYLALSAPHPPNDPTAERLARFSAIADPQRRAYAAQVSLMDDAIGETLAALHDSGQSERTLVIYFTDNGGGPGDTTGADNRPLRGVKGTLYEGGVRVPFLMSWPTQLLAGKVDERMVSAVDVFATSLAAAGVAMPTDKKYDSVNLMPFLKGEKSGAAHQQLFWRSGKVQAMREGNWKLVHKGEHAPELYNLDNDIGETTDLAAKQQQITKRLVAELTSWEKELIDPLFVGFVADRNGKAENKTKARLK